MDRIDRAVLGTLGGDVLRPAVVNAIVAGVLEALQPQTQARAADTYLAELHAVERELTRLTDSLAAAGPLPALVTAIQARQARRDELIAAIAAVDAADYTKVDVRLIEQQVRAKLEDWRGKLTKSVQDARGLLREVLAAPLRFTPENDRYRFVGNAQLGSLLSGTTCNLSGVPTGNCRHV